MATVPPTLVISLVGELNGDRTLKEQTWQGWDAAGAGGAGVVEADAGAAMIDASVIVL